MYLVIDNTAGEKLVFFISEDGRDWAEEDFSVDGEGGLLKGIKNVLEKKGKNLVDLNGLAVRVGKGRFTGTRIAVTVANTLAFSLKIPVMAIMEINLNNIVSELQKVPVGQYAHAIYSGEPRLGGGKK